ncbi:hypothetical protein LguiB_020638 [Lonicera macranthoides]
MSVDEGDKEINFDLNGDESSDNNSAKQYFHPTKILYAELEENENEDAVEFDSVGDWGGELVSRLDEQEDLSSEDSGLGEEENKMMQIIEMDDTCLPLLFHNDEVGEALQQGNPPKRKLVIIIKHYQLSPPKLRRTIEEEEDDFGSENLRKRHTEEEKYED